MVNYSWNNDAAAVFLRQFKLEIEFCVHFDKNCSHGCTASYDFCCVFLRSG